MADFGLVSRLLGHEIVDEGGESLGSVRELLINLDDGRLEYVRIALVTACGDELPLLTVPWSLVQHRASETDVEWWIDVRKSTLQRFAGVGTSEY